MDLERFDVACPRAPSPTAGDPTSDPAAIGRLDWSDIEMGQQTLSGSRKIGKLKKDDEP